MAQLFTDQELLQSVTGQVLYEGVGYFLNTETYSRAMIEQWLEEEYIMTAISSYHPRNKIIQLRFDNIVGLVNILGVTYDVRSRKLLDNADGNTQFQTLLDEINGIARSLTFKFTGTAHSHREAEHDYHQNLLEVFDYYYQLTFGYPVTDNLDALLNQCIRQPHTAYQDISVNVPLRSSKKPAPAFFTQLSKRSEWAKITAGHGMANSTIAQRTHARTGNYLLPLTVTEKQHVPTLNTLENRFIKFFLEDMAALCLRILNGRFEGEIKNKATRLHHKLLTLLRQPFFNGLIRLSFIPGSSSVLLKKSGYREIYYHFVQSKFSFRPILADVRKQAQRPGLKNIATLYEIWVFFKIAAGLFPNTLIRETFHGRVLKNGSFIGSYSWEANNARLSFNQSFTQTNGGSYSVTLRPDVSLFRNGRLYLFDAKYKFNTIVEDEDQLLRIVKAEDIHKMHAYIDAIPAAQSAIVLYPGTSYIFYDKAAGRLEETRPLNRLNGVGALPLLPNHPSHHLTSLFDFDHEG